ncbi:MAG: hypothetical protein FWB96_02775 [Defluviitaleaceae bacterium]|nr:hypothetical protein [Defluviitaleaceae bacterium]MCL2261773.1 hypothetical protein [Defluviitaleaceae bacterium]
MPPDNSAGEKKSKAGIIIFAIIFILVIAVVLVIALDIGNVRSQHIMGFVRNAPLIGSYFPADEYEEEDEMTEEEMRLQLHVYRDQIAALRATVHERDVEIATLNARVEHLERFERNWQQYRIASARFTQILAHNDPLNFVEFFEDIVNHDLVPQEILAVAWAQARAIAAYDEELRMLVSTYNNMEAGRAAEDMVRLLVTNQTLAVRILRAMGNTRRAELFDEMEYVDSSRFAILLSTEPPTFAPLVPPPYLPEFIAPEVPPFEIPMFDDDEFDEDEYYFDDENGDWDDEIPTEDEVPDPEPPAEPVTETEPEPTEPEEE